MPRCDGTLLCDAMFDERQRPPLDKGGLRGVLGGRNLRPPVASSSSNSRTYKPRTRTSTTTRTILKGDSKGMTDCKAILFDLDGTLIDTTELILYCFNHAWETICGHTHPPEVFVATMGIPLKNAMHKLLGATDGMQLEKIGELRTAGFVESLVREYRSCNAANHDRLARPFPAMKPVMASLRERGYVLGVVTSKSREFAQRGTAPCAACGNSWTFSYRWTTHHATNRIQSRFSWRWRSCRLLLSRPSTSATAVTTCRLDGLQACARSLRSGDPSHVLNWSLRIRMSWLIGRKNSWRYFRCSSWMRRRLR